MAVKNENTKEVVSKLLKESSNFSNTPLPPIINRIANEISEELNIPKKDIVMVIKAIFKFTYDILRYSVKLEDGKYKLKNLVKIRWIHFGSFKISQYRIKRIFGNKTEVSDLTYKDK